MADTVLLSQVFLDKGFQVLTAPSQGEGLLYLKRRSFDLVLTGTDTRGMDLKVLGAKRKGMRRPFPVALIAGPRAGERPQKESHPDVDLVIPKPVDIDRLVREVTNLLALREEYR